MAALQGRRLLLPLLARQALRRAVPPPIPRCRFLGSASPPAPGPRSPSDSLLPTSAAAVVPAARGAGSPGLEISALQRGRTIPGWPLPSSALLHAAAPWALWTSAAADDMVGALIGANLSVFMLWRVLAYPRFITDPHMVWLDMYFGGRLHTLLTSASSNVDPMFMRKHFMTSLDNFMSGRLHTMLTSSFSHMDFKHLFNNMVGLYFFGSSIARTFGPGFLFQLYVTGALTGSVFYLAEKIFLAPRKEVFGGWKTPCLTSLDNFMSGRLHTMLTSSFSHMNLKHLFNNMVGLYFFGSSIARTFGPGFLFQLYVTGALTGSVFYLAEKIFLAPRKEVFGGWKTPCLGASAAVNAIILLEIFLHPTKLLYLHLFIPVPAALVGVGLIGADLWRVKKSGSRVSGSSHLGGALVAAVAFAEIKGWI